MLEGYNRVWDKVSNLMKKELDSEPLYNGIIYKLKFYDGKLKRNFHDELPKEPSHCLFASDINRLFLRWAKTITQKCSCCKRK